MIIQKAIPSQAEEISKLRIDSMNKLNSKDHTKEEMIYLIGRQTPEELKKKIESRPFFVALENNKIIGSIDLEDNEIKGLYVLSSEIKKGLGTKLLSHMEKLGKKNGIKVMNICSTKSAIPFYEKNGYKLVEIRKEMKKGIMMTFHLMEKELT
ncbi:MAG: GNAT family N-acetyltransferase [archaeon]